MRLHPLLREYAAEQLRAFGPAVEEPLGDASLAYWISFARANHYQGGRDVEHLNALEAEADGLMGALAWAHAYERNRQVLALADLIGMMLRIRGRRDAQLVMCQWMVEAAEALGDTQQLRYAMHQLAATQADLGHVAEARAGYERALALARELGDPAAERAEVHELAELDRRQGRLEDAHMAFSAPWSLPSNWAIPLVSCWPSIS